MDSCWHPGTLTALVEVWNVATGCGFKCEIPFGRNYRVCLVSGRTARCVSSYGLHG